MTTTTDSDQPDPSHPDFAYESSPHLYLFTSLTAGSSQIITATSRLETILKAHRIPFHAIDTATDDKARKIWGRRAAGKKLPGLVKDGYVIADLVAVEEWNEYGELKDMLGSKGEGGAAQPVMLGGATQVTGKENARQMAAAGYAVSGPAAEGLDTTGSAKNNIKAFERRSVSGSQPDAETQQRQSSLAAEAAALGSVRANRAKFESAAGGSRSFGPSKVRIGGAPSPKATDNGSGSEPKAEETRVKEETKAVKSATEEASKAKDIKTDEASKNSETEAGTAEESTAAGSAKGAQESPDVSERITNESQSQDEAATAATETKAPVTDTTNDTTVEGKSEQVETSNTAETERLATSDSKPSSENVRRLSHTTFDTTPRHTSLPHPPADDLDSLSMSPPNATAAIALPAIPRDEMPKDLDEDRSAQKTDASSNLTDTTETVVEQHGEQADDGAAPASKSGIEAVSDQTPETKTSEDIDVATAKTESLEVNDAGEKDTNAADDSKTS